MLTAAADLNFNVVPSGLSVLAELWRSRYHTVENILEGDVFVQDASMISPAVVQRVEPSVNPEESAIPSEPGLKMQPASTEYPPHVHFYLGSRAVVI